MKEFQRLLGSCAAMALLAGACDAFGQTTDSKTANSTASDGKAATAAGSSETADQAKRAETTAQSTDAADAVSVGGVVVTAVPHGATLQRLPVSASVYTDERRNLVGITTASDIVNFTPSMSLNGENLSLRGINRVITPSFGPPPGVAVFVDGVYTDSPDYLNQPDFFSDRIEILRGPQGTLSGRNAIGGAIDVVSKRPTPTMREEVRLGGTSFDNFYADASVSGPITDTLGFRIADSYAATPHSGGYYKNLASTTNPGTGSSNLSEAQLEWKPSSDFDAWFRVQNFEDSYTPTYGVLADQYPGATSNFADAFPAEEGTRCADFQCLSPVVSTELSPTANPALANRFAINRNYVGYTRIKNDWTSTGHLTWYLPFATVEYIGGYSQYTYQASTDIDGTALTAGVWDNQIDVDNETKRWYQNEIDIKSLDDQRFRWSGGFFQYWQDYTQTYQTEEPNQPDVVNPPGGPANPQHIIYKQSPSSIITSEAVYGQVDYDLTDEVRLTGGLRYTWDANKVSNSLMEVFDTGGIFFSNFASQYIIAPSAPKTASGQWSDWTGKLGAEWRPDASTLVYGFIAKGYKSGGFVLTNILPPPSVGPEQLYDYEFGVKKTFGKTLLVNADVYYYDYRNLQEILQVRDPVSGLIVNDLAGAQKARTYGFELESVWSPTPNFQLTFNYSYLDARFVKFDNANGAAFIDFSRSTPTPCGTFDPVTFARTTPVCSRGIL